VEYLKLQWRECALCWKGGWWVLLTCKKWINSGL
jgi:hypothetical protein